jgi:hypothetical protein
MVLKTRRLSCEPSYIFCALFFSAASPLLIATDAWATSYLFTVSCESKRFVADWETGTIDPGKEYLRAATGTKNAGCMVGDYNESADKNLPRERYSDVGGVIQGLPP